MVKLSAKYAAFEEAQAGLEVKITDVEISVKGMAGAAQKESAATYRAQAEWVERLKKLETGIKKVSTPGDLPPALRADLIQVEDRLDILQSHFGDLHTKIKKVERLVLAPQAPAPAARLPPPSPPAPAGPAPASPAPPPSPPAASPVAGTALVSPPATGSSGSK